MMRKPKHEDIERGAARTSLGSARSNMSKWRFGEWLSRMIRRGCASGLWTISRDGKLGCEPLCSKPGQPD
jgi:hypothetical protein